MKHTLFGLAALSLSLGFLAAVAVAAPENASLEEQFRQLPIETRRLTGPLFWLHGDESPERLEMYVGKMAEGGNGCFTAESRPHIDWLGEGWFTDLGVCLNAAKKHDLEMWIFDEKWWPSQSIAGRVPPRYAVKQLDAASVDVAGPQQFKADGYAGERYIAAVAGRLTDDGKIDADSLVDLAPNVRDGKLSWQVPDGKWKIMKFAHVQGQVLAQTGQLSVDGASRDCVDWFIQTVYQPHYDRFGADFGKTIPGFFYDEPETRGDWGTELNPVLAERKVDWKKAYVAYKFELAGEAQAAARYQYFDAFAEAWGRTMYGGMTDWCHKHNVKSVGHFMEHGGLYFSREFCAGDMMRLQGYSDMGAIDAVFRQFEPGKRDEQYQNPPIWQTPKIGSSISHVYNKPDDVAMVEIFGARGQDLTYPEMKWWTDHMQVSGVNFMIPHSFNPRSPYDTDCPPYFYNGGFEPRWPLYRVYADYTSRLSLLLSGGRHVCPVAQLFMGQSAQVGAFNWPEAMTTALQDGQIDCDWLPYEVFEGKASVAGKELALYQERYKVLIVPPVEVIPYDTLAKAKQFFEAGGVVLGYGFLPSKSATLGRGSKDIAALCADLWGSSPSQGLSACRKNANGGRSYYLPETPTAKQLQQVFADAGVATTLQVLSGETSGWLHILHRVKDGRDVFFVCNQNHEGAARTFRFRALAAGTPECWDAMRNEITAVAFQRTSDAAVEFSLTLEPLESVLLVFQENSPSRPSRLDVGATPTRPAIELVRRPNPTPPESVAEKLKNATTTNLAGCDWIWLPGTAPGAVAPPGTACFRQAITIPADRKVKRARFLMTADNSGELRINGKQVGWCADFHSAVEMDFTRQLHEGKNVLAVMGKNSGSDANPAGVIGRYTIEFDRGEPLVAAIDATWKANGQEEPGWDTAAFDDSKWPAAQKACGQADGPWPSVNDRQLTLGPVAVADPFLAQFMLPADVDLAKNRVFLDMTDVPDGAAAVKINGAYAGGVIGKPLRLEITGHVKPGENNVLIEPLAPKSARIVIY